MGAELATIGAAAAGTALVAAVATTQASLPPPAGVKPDFTPDEAAQAIAAARGMVVAARWRETAAEVRRLTGFELGELADRQPIGLPRLSAHLYAIGAEAGLSTDEINRMLQQRFPSAEARMDSVQTAFEAFENFGGIVTRDFLFKLLSEILAEELGQDHIYVRDGAIYMKEAGKMVSTGVLWWKRTKWVEVIGDNIVSLRMGRGEADPDKIILKHDQERYEISINSKYYATHKAVFDKFLAFCRQIQANGRKVEGKFPLQVFSLRFF